jgi:hypothetical protein
VRMTRFRPKINITTRPLGGGCEHTSRHFAVVFLVLCTLGALIACRSTGRAKEHVAHGNRYLEQRQLADAENEYQQATQIDPDYGEAHYRLGLLQIEEEHPTAAIKSLPSSRCTGRSTWTERTPMRACNWEIYLCPLLSTTRLVSRLTP